MPQDTAILPGDSICHDDASRVKPGVYPALNGALVTPVRHVLPDGTYMTALTSISNGSSHPDVFGSPSHPNVLSSSGHPDSGKLTIPNSMLTMLDGVTIAAPTGMLVMPVRRRLPNDASCGSPGNSSKCGNSGTPAIPNGMPMVPNGAGMAAPTGVLTASIGHRLPNGASSGSSANGSNHVDSGI